MKNSSRFIIVILLLLFSWWLQNLLDSKPELITREKTRYPNYYLEDFTLTSHNQNGQVRYTLNAQRLDYYDSEKLAEIKTVEATVYHSTSTQPSAVNWLVSANQATIYQHDERIEFNGQVQIRRAETTTEKPLTLQTEQLILWTKQDRLESRQTVTISTGNSSMQSQGMIINGKNGTLELRNKVRARYEQ